MNKEEIKDFKFKDLFEIFKNRDTQVKSDKRSVTTNFGKLYINFAKEEVKEEVEDEFDILLKKQEAAKSLAEELIPKIEAQISRCTDIQKKLTERQGSVIDLKDSAFILKNSSDQLAENMKDRLDGLNDQLLAIDKDVNEICAELARNRDEVNKKAQKVKKWCWVPFYNLALLADYESADKNLSARLESLKKERMGLEDEKKQIYEDMVETQKKQTGSIALSILMNSELSRVSDLINQVNKMTYEWNQFSAFFTAIESQVSALDDLDTLIEDAEYQMAEAAKAEEEIDYSSFILPEFESGNYVIKTYDQAFYINCGVQGRIPESKSEVCLVPEIFTFDEIKPSSPDELASARIIDLFLIFLIDGSVAILNSDDFAITRADDGSLYFTPLQYQLNENKDTASLMDNQKFYISRYPENDGLYKIGFFGDASLCLDVTSGNFSTGTRLQLWEQNSTVSQKFRIEKMN